MSVFAAATFVSPTLAEFTDSKEIAGEIRAGTWPVPWIQTDVSLTVGDKEIESCDPVELKAKFTNQGKYRTEKGSWIMIDESEGPHEVKELKPGESVLLTYKAGEPGIYTFKVYQEGKHPSEFLKKVTVACEKPEEHKEEESEQELQEKANEDNTNVEEKQPPKPENDEKKDKEPSQPIEPVQPAEKPQPPADNDNKPQETEPAPESKPTAPAAEPKPESQPEPEPPAVKEAPVNSNSVKDEEE
ncbi:hypothetical protein [Siminovitchia fortis]|nr:hypothetical protein [Siminovitchia fortis]